MTTQSTKAAVENFAGQHRLAVVGVSRDPKKFGNASRSSTMYPKPGIRMLRSQPGLTQYRTV